jgi:hypothetical protein
MGLVYRADLYDAQKYNSFSRMKNSELGISILQHNCPKRFLNDEYAVFTFEILLPSAVGIGMTAFRIRK